MFKKNRIYNGEKTVSSASGAEKSGQPHVNQWSQNIPHTIHKNKFKMA